MADGQDGMMEAQMTLSYFHATSHIMSLGSLKQLCLSTDLFVFPLKM